uniref:Uncharacterized protein n=1 Tax=Anopheles minimus TaxID=112268 RepID=A0A182WQ60_9DIPT
MLVVKLNNIGCTKGNSLRSYHVCCALSVSIVSKLSVRK